MVNEGKIEQSRKLASLFQELQKDILLEAGIDIEFGQLLRLKAL